MSTFDYESTISSLRSSIIVASDTTEAGLLNHLCMSMNSWLPILDSLEEEYDKVWREAYNTRKENPEQQQTGLSTLLGYDTLTESEKKFVQATVNGLYENRQKLDTESSLT